MHVPRLNEDDRVKTIIISRPAGGGNSPLTVIRKDADGNCIDTFHANLNMEMSDWTYDDEDSWQILRFAQIEDIFDLGDNEDDRQKSQQEYQAQVDFFRGEMDRLHAKRGQMIEDGAEDTALYWIDTQIRATRNSLWANKRQAKDAGYFIVGKEEQ